MNYRTAKIRVPVVEPNRIEYQAINRTTNEVLCSADLAALFRCIVESVGLDRLFSINEGYLDSLPNCGYQWDWELSIKVDPT